MTFNVQDFRSSLRFDGARPNLFEVSMSTANLGIGNIDEDMKFKCRVAQLPEDNIATIPVNYFGREIKIAGNRTFPEMSLTIINDEDFRIRNAFERWMSGINSHVRNFRRNSYQRSQNYSCDTTITQFSKFGDSGSNGKAIKKYKLIGCWPTNVSAIDLDWGANDQIEEFTVTLAYQWWESVPQTDSTGSGASASFTVSVG